MKIFKAVLIVASLLLVGGGIYYLVTKGASANEWIQNAVNNFNQSDSSSTSELSQIGTTVKSIIF